MEPEDLLTLIYTSGTTGPPKGVQLAHRNLMAAVAGIEELVQFPEGARVISWLPAAHIAERAAHHYLPIVFGFTITAARTRARSSPTCPTCARSGSSPCRGSGRSSRPAWRRCSRASPTSSAQALERALDAARQEGAPRAGRGGGPRGARRGGREGRRGALHRLRAQLGLDQLVAVNVGAAPTPVEVLEFFHAIGIPLAELWGMSETCGAGASTRRTRIKIGTVGPPTPGVELKLADDGEVLIRATS